MDPWRNKVSDIHIRGPPYAPSAALSMYAPMLEAFLQYFPAEQMQVVNYEDLVEHPFDIVNRLLRHIGVLAHHSLQT